MNKLVMIGMSLFFGFGIYCVYDCFHSVSSSMNEEKKFVDDCVEQYIETQHPHKNEPGYNLLISTVNANCQFAYMKIKGR